MTTTFVTQPCLSAWLTYAIVEMVDAALRYLEDIGVTTSESKIDPIGSVETDDSFAPSGARSEVTL